VLPAASAGLHCGVNSFERVNERMIPCSPAAVAGAIAEW
jgi:hypothetical protein